MREILGVTDEPRTRRRWFHDDYFDLFVWETGGGEITSFQLCYGIDSSERALVWLKDRGFFHDGVETGATGSGETLGAGPAPGDPIISRFETAARALPDGVRRAVTARIREYIEKGPPAPARRKRFRRADWQQHKPEAH